MGKQTLRVDSRRRLGWDRRAFNRARKAGHFTLKEIASRMGVGYGTAQRWGQGFSPTDEQVGRLARFLPCTAADLRGQQP